MGDLSWRWYIYDRESDQLLRGPYKHRETAAAVREEMERNATAVENAKWSLWVTEREDDA